MDAPDASTAEAGWQAELLSSFTSLADLAEAGLIDQSEAELLRDVGCEYRVRIPRYYAGLIDQSLGRSCPIRKQALPALGENDPKLPEWAQEWSLRAFGRATPWVADAIGDLAKLAAPRLTHRYGNRAILHVSSLCALYCRFCFRKSHLNDSERSLYEGRLDEALAYLRGHPEIRELILTGGDPLSMPDGWLTGLLGRLEAIESLTHVRIHSRMPVTLPSRLSAALAEILANRRFVVSLVSHFNHPKELTPVALGRLAVMRRAGIPLFNQSVLLKGVNDDDLVLKQLFQTLYENGVAPFYLHHPDWTPGTFHFRLPISTGRELVRRLEGRVSGPALPRYVLDLPGGDGKTPLTADKLTLLETRSEKELGGALYEVQAVATREAPAGKGPVLYAEFWEHGAKDPA